MLRPSPRRWSWPIGAAMFLCVLAQFVHAAPAAPSTTSRLVQIERLRTADHPQFVHELQQLRTDAARMTPGERWYLRYLEAWQMAFRGDYAKADASLQDVIDHSGDATLVAKSTALLMDDMVVNSRYEDAFRMANRLAAGLPQVTDKLARFIVLADLSQLLGSAGQYDQSIRYARMMEMAIPPGESLCTPRTQQMTTLFNANKLASSSPDLHRAIETCEAAGQSIFADTLQLIMGSLYLSEGHADKALALIQAIAPSIKINQYAYHVQEAHALLAQAYWQLADYADARKAALAALALARPDEISPPLRDAYQVLYRVEKHGGDAAAALAYYEHFAAQDKGYLDDVSARALAYQIVQQQTLATKLETEELGKQNNMLRLQQALDTKAVEASRLYIALLLIVLASIVLWLYRLKRSQLRFKVLARRDGLTGILNHQHFISEADRALRLMERRGSSACLISIDLDHFKQVNDTHGHAMGDAVLMHAVMLCQRQLRPTDVFGRLGGEEFGILLHECTRAQGMEIANRIRLAIESTPMKRDGHVVAFSASVGLASSNASGYSLQHLWKDADAALYQAKRAGRNRVMAASDAGSLAAV